MKLVIDCLGGNCPVQGKGSVDGVPFYFRARYDEWSMGIGSTPAGIAIGFTEGWRRREAWGDGAYNAGWMEHDEARAIIERCAAEYAAERAALEQGNEKRNTNTNTNEKENGL